MPFQRMCLGPLNRRIPPRPHSNIVQHLLHIHRLAQPGGCQLLSLHHRSQLLLLFSPLLHILWNSMPPFHHATSQETKTHLTFDMFLKVVQKTPSNQRNKRHLHPLIMRWLQYLRSEHLGLLGMSRRTRGRRAANFQVHVVKPGIQDLAWERGRATVWATVWVAVCQKASVMETRARLSGRDRREHMPNPSVRGFALGVCSVALYSALFFDYNDGGRETCSYRSSGISRVPTAIEIGSKGRSSQKKVLWA